VQKFRKKFCLFSILQQWWKNEFGKIKNKKKKKKATTKTSLKTMHYLLEDVVVWVQ
jgi:hypothetical protein